MSAPLDPQGSEPQPAARRSMTFVKRRRTSLPTAEESRRQSTVVRSAWRHFGEPGPVIAFLNTQHAALEAQPLHLAIESDEGLERVETLLNQMTLKA